MAREANLLEPAVFLLSKLPHAEILEFLIEISNFELLCPAVFIYFMCRNDSKAGAPWCHILQLFLAFIIATGAEVAAAVYDCAIRSESNVIFLPLCLVEVHKKLETTANQSTSLSLLEQQGCNLSPKGIFLIASLHCVRVRLMETWGMSKLMDLG